MTEFFTAEGVGTLLEEGEPVLDRREFNTIAAISALVAAASFSCMHGKEHHGISEKRREELFKEQEAGYGRSRKLSRSFTVNLSDSEPKTVPTNELKKVYGEEQVAKALKGGKIIILCSDDRVVPPEDKEDQEPWVKLGLPGSGELVPGDKRPAFFGRLGMKLGGSLQATTHHHPCGACKGDRERAEAIGDEAHKLLGGQLPYLVSGYGNDGDLDMQMTGDPAFHEGLGFVISGQSQFNTGALGMERHMHLGAIAFEDTPEGNDMLNFQAQTLFMILMGHGWGADGFAKRPLQIKIVGSPDDPENITRKLWERLRPLRELLTKLEKDFQAEHSDDPELKSAKLFEIVVINAPHTTSLSSCYQCGQV